MIAFFRLLLPLLDRSTRRRLAVSAAAMLVLASLEAVALVALVPLMQILTAPDMKPDSDVVGRAAILFGNPSSARLAVYLAVIVFSLYVFKSIAAMLVLRWTTTFALTEEATMVHRLVSVYLRAPYTIHLERNSAEMVRTLTQSFMQIFRVGLVQSLNAIGESFSVLLVGAILLVADPFLALAVGTYFVVVTLTYQHIAHRSIGKAARLIHERQATDYRTIHQSLLAVKEIKVRNVEDHFADAVYEVRDSLVPAYRTMSLVTIIPRYVLELAMVGAAALVAAIAFQTKSVSAATATIGVFLAGGFRMLAPLNKVIFGVSQAKAAVPSLEQVRNDLDEAEARSPREALEQVDIPEGSLRPRISLRDLSFAYAPGVPVLSGVTVDIDPGEAIGLVGSSGAGKSTLVDIVLGLLEPDSGDILIDGWPLSAVRRQWQRSIGYVPQVIALFDDTVTANVALGVPADEVDHDQLWHALALAQLDDVVRALPNGVDNVIGESGVQLSGGQRQRIGVARALYLDPQVLMFDEATSALDSETEFKLTEVLDSLRGRLTTLTIAHRLSTVRRCDRLLYLEQGTIEAQGSFDELNAAIPGFMRMVDLAAL
jgi:ABC-type multidrug transport system fused ATPase/permease subunit